MNFPRAEWGAARKMLFTWKPWRKYPSWESSSSNLSLIHLVFMEVWRNFHGSMVVRKVLKLESVWRDDEKPLSVDEEALLRQAIYAGWIDRVAKRIKGNAYIRPAWSNRLCSSICSHLFLILLPSFWCTVSWSRQRNLSCTGLLVSLYWLVKYGHLAKYDRQCDSNLCGSFHNILCQLVILIIKLQFKFLLMLCFG